MEGGRNLCEGCHVTQGGSWARSGFKWGGGLNSHYVYGVKEYVGIALFKVDRYVSTVPVAGSRRPYGLLRLPGRRAIWGIVLVVPFCYGCMRSISVKWYLG